MFVLLFLSFHGLCVSVFCVCVFLVIANLQLFVLCICVVDESHETAGNQLTRLPDSLGNLSRLRVLLVGMCLFYFSVIRRALSYISSICLSAPFSVLCMVCVLCGVCARACVCVLCRVVGRQFCMSCGVPALTNQTLPIPTLTPLPHSPCVRVSMYVCVCVWD